MRIDRRGLSRNHGYQTICSTFPDSTADVVTQRGKIAINIALEKDHERSGGGEHLHIALLEVSDVAKIVYSISNALGEEKLLAEELRTHFQENITAIERLKLAILGVL